MRDEHTGCESHPVLNGCFVTLFAGSVGVLVGALAGPLAGAAVGVLTLAAILGGGMGRPFDKGPYDR